MPFLTRLQRNKPKKYKITRYLKVSGTPDKSAKNNNTIRELKLADDAPDCIERAPRGDIFETNFLKMFDNKPHLRPKDESVGGAQSRLFGPRNRWVSVNATEEVDSSSSSSSSSEEEMEPLRNGRVTLESTLRGVGRTVFRMQDGSRRSRASEKNFKWTWSDTDDEPSISHYIKELNMED